MPRTIENLLAAHEIATERRQAGRPVWALTLKLADVFHNDAMTGPERYKEIARRLRTSGWGALTDDTEWLEFLAEQLEHADGPHTFDCWWDEVYDLANIDRV